MSSSLLRTEEIPRASSRDPRELQSTAQGHRHLSSLRQPARLILWAILIPLLLPGLILSPHQASAQPLENPETVPRLEWGSCDFPIPSGFTEGTDALCGYLVVPESRDIPDGPTLRLAILILKARNETEQNPPLVILHGGPGGSAIKNMVDYFTSSRILYDRDVILIDQRGSGYSEPRLDCPELIDYWYDDSEANEEEGSEENGEAQALEACKERLTQEGIDAEAYTTEENAADIEDLRKALGYEKIDLYGVSYGSDLAIAVMSTYPSGIRSVILDSPVPGGGGTAASEIAALHEIIKACNRNPECRSAFPSLNDDLQEAIDRLDDKPITIHIAHPKTEEITEWLIYGHDFTSILAEAFRDDMFVSIGPLIIHDAGNGRYVIIEIMAELIGEMMDSVSLGTNVSTRCTSDTTYFTDDFISADVEDSSTEAQDEAGDPEYDDCAIWLGEGSSGSETPNETNLPPPTSIIPTLVLSGRFDPLTTPDYGHWIAEQLPSSTAVTIENAGHGTIGSSTCVDAVMAQFLDDPSEPVDLECTMKLSEIYFVTPDEIVRLPILEIGLGIYRRSPLILGLIGVYGLSCAIFTLGAVISVIVLPTIRSMKTRRRINRLARKWENLYLSASSSSVRKTRTLTTRKILLIALILLFIFWVSWAVESELLLRINLYIQIVSLLIFPYIIWRLIHWRFKKIRINRLLTRRAKKLSRVRNPWLVRKTPLFTIGAVLLITLSVFGIFIVLWDQIYYYGMSVFFGYPRSAWLIDAFLGGALILCFLGVIGTVIGRRRSSWSKARRGFQTVISASSIIVIGSLSILVFLGHF
jgi:pimeloyl-ACP methyl ester carboxylesterase